MSLLSQTKKLLGRDEAKKPVKKGKAKATKPTIKPADDQAVLMMPVQAGRIDLRPHVTEKSVGRSDTGNVAVFRVTYQTTKGQIAAAVKERYKVTPTHIRTLTMKPKSRTRGRTVGSTSAWKKAYVSLPANTSIDLTV